MEEPLAREWFAVDDRGVERWLVAPESFREMGFTPGEMASMKRVSSKTGCFFIAWCAVMVVYLPFVYWRAAFDVSMGMWTPTIAMALIFSVQWVLFARQARRGTWRPDKFGAGMLELRRCPSCAYRLVGSVIEADGCAVCAECGAAWRVGEAGEGGSGVRAHGASCAEVE